MATLINVGEYRNDSERWAAEFLEQNLPDQYTIFANVDVFDDFGFRLDCDQIILGEYAVYVVEVKGYSGVINAGEHDWIVGDSKAYRSPVSATTTKAKALASRIRERKAGRRIHTPWCQPVVFVTGGRGGEVTLNLEEKKEAVFTKRDIVSALQSSEILNTVHRNPLSRDQKDLAARVVGNLRLLRSRPVMVGSFTTVKELGRAGRIRVCTGVHRIGELEREFLLRMAESFSYEHPDLWRVDCQMLTEEARLYHELASIPGIPYAAPLIEEDECVTFGIAYPAGRPLAMLQSAALEDEFRLDVLHAVANTLNHVHLRGMAHGGLTPEWIYVTDGGSVELLNLSPSPTVEAKWSAPELADGRSADSASDVWSLARIFASWFDVPSQAGASQTKSSHRTGLEELTEWFQAALDPQPSERPPISDLIRTLRRLELGIVAEPAAPEEPFRLESGALLHGTFRLEDSLGSGPAGEVWRARHDRGNYPLALYFPERGEEEFLRARFEEIAGLHHPMVVRAYDMRRVPGQDAMYMAADWQDGDPLDQILENAKRPDHATILGWLRDALIALEFVHGQDVLHRNISPDAIVIVQGRPRLVEFSLLPETDRRAGLIEYSDPRVSETGWHRESDLYALAAIFLNLLAGITPRTSRGTVLETAQIEKALPVAIPAEVRHGLLTVLAPEFELETARYAELFGIQEPPKSLDKLPDEFLKQWGLSLTGHQERIARFMIQEFHGKGGGRARARTQVVKGSLALTDVQANRTLRAAANSAISALKTKGVLFSPSGTRAVKPTEEFLKSWSAFNAHGHG